MSRGSSNLVSINALLEKTKHYDKDERYMATSDLCELLKRQGDASSGGQPRLDASTEKRICTEVLRLLHDKSNDVQAIAVKTLGVLLTTVQEEQVMQIADSLTDQVLDSSKSELRDVYAIGLRTLIKTIPSTLGDAASSRLVGRLLEGIRSTTEEIVLACLDVLTDLLGRFGATSLAVTRQHEPILHICLKQLSNNAAPVIRKRAGNSLGCLSVVLSDALLVSMVERLLAQIDMADGLGKAGKRKAKEQKQASGISGEAGDTRALIRTMCVVSGAVGHRLQQAQIDRILPIFFRFTDPEDAVTGDDDFDDGDGDDDMDDGYDPEDEAAIALANELRESCFMGFESFVLRCPTQVQPHLQSIIEASLAYMSYDPNYSYGVDDEEDEDGDGGEDDEDDEFEVEDDDDEFEDDDDEEEDDDDDESWKVRRSAIRALNAVVDSKRHDPSMLWTKDFNIRKGRSSIVAKALVDRFKEREENCRVGVLECFNQLLDVTILAASHNAVSFGTEDDMDTSSSGGVSIDLRSKYVPPLVKGCEKLLSVKKGGERSKSQAMFILCTLCKAPGGIGGDAELLGVFQHVQTFLAGASEGASQKESSSKTLRLEALSLVHSVLTCGNHDPVHIRKGLRTALLSQLCQSVQEKWYKVIAEALRALSAVPSFFVIGYTDADDDATKKTEGDEVSNLLFGAIEPLLAAHDVDQEIKECALSATAALLSNLHQYLNPEQTKRLLDLLLERLRNETTRIPAIKTLSAIASASATEAETMADEDKISLASIFEDSVSTMAGFLKLQSRSLKQHALEALDVILTTHGSSGRTELFSALQCDLAPLVNDSDLHLSHLSLRVSISGLKSCPACGEAAKAHVLPNALTLSTSTMLQDLALDSLLAFFEQIVSSNAVDFAEVSQMLTSRLSSNSLGKHATYNLARCIATVAAATTAANREAMLSTTLTSLESMQTPPQEAALKEVQLSLLISGDLGRLVDLSTIGGATDRLQTIYMGYFQSPSEDLKHASSYALGRAAVGASSVFLPSIVGALQENNQKKQYLLLSALRGFIQCSFQDSGGEGVAASLPTILPHLEKHCADEEEGVRTMVAECMGSLICMNPAPMLEKLQSIIASHSAIAAPGGKMDPEDATSKKNSLACWTVATSVKLSIAGKASVEHLAVAMPKLLELLKVEELAVRNAALLMVYSAVHHMPQLLAGCMKDTIVPVLHEIAGLKMERKVDLGPFTHTVDDALPLRKASMSIFATCLESLPGSLDIPAFMPVLAKALADVEDIQLQAHHIIIAMSQRQPTFLVPAIDTFVDPLEKTMHKKKGTKTGTELERLNEWIKSALRAAFILSKVEGVTNSKKFADFYGRTRANVKFQAMLGMIEEER